MSLQNAVREEMDKMRSSRPQRQKVDITKRINETKDKLQTSYRLSSNAPYSYLTREIKSPILEKRLRGDLTKKDYKDMLNKVGQQMKRKGGI